MNDGYNLKDIQLAFEDTNEEKDSLLEQQALLFSEMLVDFDFLSLHRDDIPITYYVAGYIARRLIKKTKCQICHKLFSKNQEEINVEVDSTDATVEEVRAGEQFINQVSRGGLIKPSQLLNVVAAHANSLCKFIKGNQDLLKALISSKNSRTVFTKAFVSKLNESSTTTPVLEAKCESGHKFIGHVPIISNVIFNIFSKNYVAEQNSLIHKSRKRAKESETVEDEKKIKRDPCEMKKKIEIRKIIVFDSMYGHYVRNC